MRSRKPRMQHPAHQLSYADISKYFHLPIVEAAKEMNICTSLLKKVCRANGIQRWPYRKLKSLEGAVQSLSSVNSALSPVPSAINLSKQQVRLLQQIQKIYLPRNVRMIEDEQSTALSLLAAWTRHDLAIMDNHPPTSNPYAHNRNSPIDHVSGLSHSSQGEKASSLPPLSLPSHRALPGFSSFSAPTDFPLSKDYQNLQLSCASNHGHHKLLLPSWFFEEKQRLFADKQEVPPGIGSCQPSATHAKHVAPEKFVWKYNFLN